MRVQCPWRKQAPEPEALILQELQRLEALGTHGVIDRMALNAYVTERRRGLARIALCHWFLQRAGFRRPERLPEDFDLEDLAIEMPEWLKE